MKKLLVLLILCVSSAFGGASALASGIAFKACRQAEPSLVARLKRSIGRDWHFYEAFMETCPVLGPDGRTVLRVIALSLPKANRAGRLFALNGRAWNAPSDTASYDTLPLPLVLNKAGHVVARLPVDVFPMPPISTHIVFRDWRDGRPLDIVMRRTDPTISPPISSCNVKELVWDDDGRYISNPRFCSQGRAGQSAKSGD